MSSTSALGILTQAQYSQGMKHDFKFPATMISSLSQCSAEGAFMLVRLLLPILPCTTRHSEIIVTHVREPFISVPDSAVKLHAREISNAKPCLAANTRANQIYQNSRVENARHLAQP